LADIIEKGMPDKFDAHFLKEAQYKSF